MTDFDFMLTMYQVPDNYTRENSTPLEVQIHQKVFRKSGRRPSNSPSYITAATGTWKRLYTSRGKL